MNKDKLILVLEGAIVVALGILIAIFGLATVLDTYFGILAVVSGAILAILGIVAISKKQELSLGTVTLACILITVGVGLLIPGWLTVASIILFLVFILIGLGGGLIFYGIYSLAKGRMVFGVAQLIAGIALLVIGILYLTVNDFAKAFYIALGIAIAVYGVLLIVSAFLDTKKKQLETKHEKEGPKTFFFTYKVNQNFLFAKALTPKNSAFSPSSSSILRSWLYFAIRSVLLAEPVLI